MGERKDFFEIINIRAYHEALFHAWIRLSKDGLVAKDDEESFGQLGRKFVAHIFNTHSAPDYGVIISWVPEILPR